MRRASARKSATPADAAPHGWIAGRAYRIGAGSVASVARVYEPAGYTGQRVTPYPQPQYDHDPSRRFTIDRRGRTVYASQREAEASEESGR